MNAPVWTVPLSDPPAGFPADAIAEIHAPDAGLTLRQNGPYRIAVTLRTIGQVHHYRFADACPRHSAGIYATIGQPSPPGSGFPDPHYSGQILAYHLRQGSVHIVMTDPGSYRIRLRAGERKGELNVTTHRKYNGRIALIPIPSP